MRGMILSLIRHGLTPSNLGHRFNDHEHEPLDASGLGAFVGLAVDRAAYDRVDVSPLRRAVETAERLGLTDYRLEPRITERGLGCFQGLTAAECRERYPDAFAAFERYEAEPAIPHGESRRAHLARVRDWLDDVRRSGAANALAVTHGGVIDFVYRLALDKPIHGGGTIFGGDNLSCSTFALDGDRIKMIAFSAAIAPLTGEI
jgi:2,3-bisphosphoglycerate-dependent phosphoglycerate mutase